MRLFRFKWRAESFSITEPAWLNFVRRTDGKVRFGIALPTFDGPVKLEGLTIVYSGPRLLYFSFYPCRTEYWVRDFAAVQEALCLLKRSGYKIVARHDFSVRREI